MLACAGVVVKPRSVSLRTTLIALCSTLALCSACDRRSVSPSGKVELRDGQPVAQAQPTPLYSPKFVIRGMAADAQNLYISGLELPEQEGGSAGQSSTTGVIMKIPLLGVPELLAEGPFIPMNTLRLVDGKLYWHERHDSPEGRGLRSLSTDGGEFERVSEIAGQSWVIRPDVVYFTRPDDEIDEGGFYRQERGSSKAKLVGRRRGVVRTLLAPAARESGKDTLYWTTRVRRDRTWAVYEWDGGQSGKELLRSDETFASLAIDGDDFLWVTWAEDQGEPLHSLYRRAIAGGDAQVLARKLGQPGFMEVFSDEQHVYLTTVQGGELRRLARAGGEIETLAGSGDRNVIGNRFNLFWVDSGVGLGVSLGGGDSAGEGQGVYWMRK